MIIKHSAAAGTLESCDAVISVAPAQEKSIQVDAPFVTGQVLGVSGGFVIT